MESTADHPEPHGRHSPVAHLSRLLHAASANWSRLRPSKTPSSPPYSSRIHLPLLLPNSVLSLAYPSVSAQPDSVSFKGQKDPASSSSSSIKSISSPGIGSEFPSAVRIATGKSGGPAFVGRVFSMCDLSDTGLMGVSTHFDIPFLSKRTPEWLKKMFAAVTKSERNGPVFRFFMDLGDAVSYVKRLNIPSGVVGACRLDIAYEHFKEKPDLFQFVPNEKQVKEAKKLLRTLPYACGDKKVEGVPVFSAQNLDIAIATKEGIKWYTPYFFDKSMLDSILEDSVDQHFHSLIETRHLQRQRDVVEDNLGAEIAEEIGESMWDPLEPEVQEVLDEMDDPGIPLSVFAKAAELQLLYSVDRVLLGNKWLRKATGIQPKFPYMVDSFEKRSAASFLRAKRPPKFLSDAGFDDDAELQIPHLPETGTNDNFRSNRNRLLNFLSPFEDWLSHPWLKQQGGSRNLLETREGKDTATPQLSPLLPKITMVGISTGEPGKTSKASLKQTMDDLTRELERAEQVNRSASNVSEHTIDDERDPLFVANVGDYPGGSLQASSVPWVRGG